MWFVRQISTVKISYASHCSDQKQWKPNTCLSSNLEKHMVLGQKLMCNAIFLLAQNFVNETTLLGSGIHHCYIAKRHDEKIRILQQISKKPMKNQINF